VHEAARVLAAPGRLCLAIPHPVNSAGDFSGREPGAPFLITGSYLEERPAPWVYDKGGLRMTFHSEHRPLESYTRALEQAGLLTEALREVGVSEHRAARDASDRRFLRIPLFLHLRAVKPG
jgi:hypothetical protein